MNFKIFMEFIMIDFNLLNGLMGLCCALIILLIVYLSFRFITHLINVNDNYKNEALYSAFKEFYYKDKDKN